jgi:transcriptional regulator with XRE-family HTH domain
MNHRDYVAEREARDPEFRAAREALRPYLEMQRTLIRARLAAGLSQRELAERIGTTQSAIARLEGGSQWPKLDTLYHIATALGVRFTIDATSPLTLQAPPGEPTAPTEASQAAPPVRAASGQRG